MQFPKRLITLYLCFALMFPALGGAVVITRERLPTHDNERLILNPDTGDAVYWGNEEVPSVVVHEHSGHATVHLHVKGLTADQSYILLDLSDTTHWKHTEGELIHIEWIDVSVDTSVSGQFNVEFWFLENCSTTDCDAHMLYGVPGAESTGNSKIIATDWGQHGPLCTSEVEGHLSNMVSLDDTTYQTDVPMKSAYNTTTATQYPGDGDVILVFDWIAGTSDLEVDVAYHTHSTDHF